MYILVPPCFLVEKPLGRPTIGANIFQLDLVILSAGIWPIQKTYDFFIWLTGIWSILKSYENVIWTTSIWPILIRYDHVIWSKAFGLYNNKYMTLVIWLTGIWVQYTNLWPCHLANRRLADKMFSWLSYDPVIWLTGIRLIQCLVYPVMALSFGWQAFGIKKFSIQRYANVIWSTVILLYNV